MKKNLLALISSLLLILISALITQNAYTHTAGAPAQKTGSPGDGSSCTSCHGGAASTQSGWITSNIPASGYVHGQTYTITATATQTGLVKFGFEVSPQNASGAQLGTLVATDLTNTQLLSGTKYITHKSAGTIGTTGFHTWTFDWIAPAQGTGDVTFYGAFLCTNNNNGSSGDATVLSSLTVSECNASASITAGGVTTFCQGGSVTLTATAGYPNYLWSNGATTQAISATSSGSYSVTVSTALGCTAASTATSVTVNPLPTVPTITASGPVSFCQGGSVTLNAGAGYSGYHWSNNSTTQSITVSSSGNYAVTVTNANGCSVVSASPTTVTVNALPNPSIAGSTTLCFGASSLLNAGAGYSQYLWSTGATTQTILVSAAATYGVTVTTSAGCTGTTSVIVDIGNALTPNIVLNGSANICEGDTLTLDAGSGFVSYIWSNGELGQTITTTLTDTFSVVVADASGCTGISNQVVTAAIDTPVCSCSFSPNPVCLNQTVTGIADGDTSWTYIWSDTSGNTQTGSQISFAATQSVGYSIEITNQQNCIGHQNATITVLQLPSAPVISLNGTTLESTATGTLTYQWQLNGTDINGATNSTYNAGTTAGNYILVITDAAGCSAQSLAFTYTDVVTIQENEITVFPNPFSDFIYIRNLEGENEITVSNLQGQILYSIISSDKTEAIQLSNLEPGFYILKIKSDRNIINRMMVKQ